MKKTKLSKAIHSAIALSIVAGTTTNAVYAQEDEQLVEEVYITGSRISRDQFSSSSPISAFDASELQQSGVASIDEFLKDVPAFTGYQMGTSTNNGSDQGQKKVDMRGLGFNRTLVLINGRRQIGDVNGDGAVDLNSVPSAMVKRVEVLKDGASTVYGSDALAGVVNIILHDDFEGFQVTGNWGQGVEDGQAENQELGLLAGISGDRGNMVMSFGYSNQEEMVQAERPWATESLYPQLQDDGSFVAIGSGSSNSRRMRSIVSPTAGDVAGNWIFDETTGQARPFEATDTYNFAPVNALITPNERYQFGALGTIEISDSVDGYMEALFTKRTSQQRLAPDASFRVTTLETPNNGVQRNDFVPANNPFNPFGVNGWGPDGVQNTADDMNTLGINDADLSINRRFGESGGRLFRQSATTYRMVAGLMGEIANVNWDFSYTVAENEVIDETKNYGRFDRWAIAVDPVACAADVACTEAGGVLNPFGRFPGDTSGGLETTDSGSITAEQMAYLSTGSLKDQYFGRLELFSLNLSGDMFELSGGAAGWAVGLEHRREEGFFSPDEFISEGLTTGGANDPQNGSFSVDEIYGEVFLPALDNLSFSASARYSDYDTVGSTATFKIGTDYAPIESVRIRAGYSTGFRAPNISEINQGDETGFPVVEPLCEFGDRRLAAGDISQTLYDNCQALGVDTTDAGEYGFAWQSAYTTSASTEELEPEESSSVNVGVVFTPSFIDGLQLSVDYWDIEVEELIDSDDLNDLMFACMNSVNLSAAACSVFPNGEPFDGGFPADATSNFGNLGTLSTNGFDFDALYNGEVSAGLITGYTLGWSATWQREYIRDFPLAGTRDLTGTANGFEVFPEWRFNTKVGIEGNNWSVTWKTRYIDETQDALRPATITDDAVAESVLYHDLVGEYTWENVSFVLGINNLADEDPSRFHSAFNANTEPGTYDVIGRRVFSSIKVTF